ncbi:MAG: M20/M25/M40 family metallo-hydrolase [Anaerolineae bacterium]|nr:M20/M25/M40 family metallo-hydrolase [Anaerolineae bacterium]
MDLWKTPPFEPQVRKDNIYARGASDDKGQLLMLVKAVWERCCVPTVRCRSMSNLLLKGKRKEAATV